MDTRVIDSESNSFFDDPTRRLVLPLGSERPSCADLQEALTSRRRFTIIFEDQVERARVKLEDSDRNFTSYRVIEERQILAKNHALERLEIDTRALQACFQAGGEVNGECPRQEIFLLRSQTAMREANAALAETERTLARLNAERIELDQARQQLENELDKIGIETEAILRAMNEMGCEIS